MTRVEYSILIKAALIVWTKERHFWSTVLSRESNRGVGVSKRVDEHRKGVYV